ncbi:hypothetical protein D9M70_384230 [compost metagenome]
MAGLGCQRAVQADDLRFAEQFVERQVAGAEGLHLGVGDGVVGQQLAAEAGHDAREGGADLPGADHADALADQVEAGQPVQAEVAFAGAVVGAVQAPVEGQDQRHRVLGHGVRRVGRHPCHGQAEALCGGQVDMVVAGRAQGDQPRAAGGQALQHRAGEVVVDERADHLATLRQGRGGQVQAHRLEQQLGAAGQRLGEEAVAVVGLAAEQDDAHGVSLSMQPEMLL